MQALLLTVCIALIVNILQPHLLLCKPVAAVALPEAATAQVATEDAANETTFKPCYEKKSEEELSLQRMNVLKKEILSKLGYEEAPKNRSNIVMLTEEDNASFSAVLALNEAIIKEQQEQYTIDNCNEKATFYAKEVKLYFPSHFHGELPSVNMFNWDSILFTKRHRRDKNYEKYTEKDESKNNPDSKPETATEATTTTTTTYEPLSHTPSPPPNAKVKQLTSLLTPIKYELNFSELYIPVNRSLWSATLQLFKRKIIFDNNLIKRTPNPTVNVEIFWISTFIDKNGNHIPYPVLIKSQNVGTENDGYVSFDITEAVKRWIEQGLSSQLQLKVRIQCPEAIDTGLLFLPSVQFDVPNSRNKGSNDANLIIKNLAESSEESNTRTKRQNIATKREYCLENPNVETCCLKESTINFHEDLGFDWILAPETFQLTYCKGLCPRILSHGTTNLEFRGQLRTTNPTSSPEPCCVPHDTRPLTLLTRRESKLELLRLPGMIVDSCQCR